LISQPPPEGGEGVEAREIKNILIFLYFCYILLLPLSFIILIEIIPPFGEGVTMVLAISTFYHYPPFGGVAFAI